MGFHPVLRNSTDFQRISKILREFPAKQDVAFLMNVKYLKPCAHGARRSCQISAVIWLTWILPPASRARGRSWWTTTERCSKVPCWVFRPKDAAARTLASSNDARVVSLFAALASNVGQNVWFWLGSVRVRPHITCPFPFLATQGPLFFRLWVACCQLLLISTASIVERFCS